MRNETGKTSSRVVLGTAVVCLAAFSVVTAFGQSDSTQSRADTHREQFQIKGFPHAEIDGLRVGEGMGMAKAAELNNYPGPRHVLDLAEELKLTPEQTKGSEALYQQMKKDAMLLGERILEREAKLEELIAEGTITPDALFESLKTIAHLRGQLRYTHMVAHLKQRKLLSAEQVKGYNRLRGHTE